MCKPCVKAAATRPCDPPLFAGPFAASLTAVPKTLEPPVLPGEVITPKDEAKRTREPGYLVICWNDPVNTTVYVTHVFQKVFGWDRSKAEKHMMEVHEQGKSVLAKESFEKAEFYVHQLQKYSLQATMEPEE